MLPFQVTDAIIYFYYIIQSETHKSLDTMAFHTQGGECGKIESF